MDVLKELTYQQRKNLYTIKWINDKYNSCPEYREKRCAMSADANRKRYNEDPEYRAKKQEANRIYQTALRAKKKLNELSV
jgi:hypothetical protein